MKQFAIALDQLINAMFGGMADETISARVYRNNWTLVEKFINLIFWDSEHCKKSYESEMKRLQLPKEYSNGTE
jgi:hypothetical protein